MVELKIPPPPKHTDLLYFAVSPFSNCLKIFPGLPSVGYTQRYLYYAALVGSSLCLTLWIYMASVRKYSDENDVFKTVQILANTITGTDTKGILTNTICSDHFTRREEN